MWVDVLLGESQKHRLPGLWRSREGRLTNDPMDYLFCNDHPEGFYMMTCPTAVATSIRNACPATASNIVIEGMNMDQLDELNLTQA
eukprot:3360219-Rhodomonas_salina.1